MIPKKSYIRQSNLSGALVLRRYFNLLFILFLLLSGTLSISAENVQGDKNNYILILSSFGYEDEWGTGIAKSIRTEIEKKNSDALVNITYADLIGRKSFLGGRLGMQAAFANARLSSTQLVPAVLVLIGDEAWMYYRIMNLRGVWESIPVVLVGINQEIMADYSLFFSDKNVSEEDFIPLQETFGAFNIKALVNDNSETRTVDLIRQLFPERKEIYFIAGDKSYQDFYVSRQIQSYIQKNYPESHMKIISGTSQNTDSICTLLESNPENAIILTNSYKLSGEIPVPVFSVRRTCLKNRNILGGYCPSMNNYGVQAADIILNVFENRDQNSTSDISPVKGVSLYLNKEALDIWDVKTTLPGNQGIIYENIPPSFWTKYKRPLLISALIVAFLAIMLILIIRARMYSNSLKNSMESYKKLYEEYQIAYENMPMGLIQLDASGNIYKYNPIAGKILKDITQKEVEEFNVCKSGLFDEGFCSRIRKKEYIDNIFSFGEYTYRVIIRYLGDVSLRKDNVLMIFIDITEIQREKKSKEEIYSMFNFAMNASSLGISEYNLLDGNGFATDAWYRNLGVEKHVSFSDLCTNVIPEDKERIHNFLKEVKEGKENVFLETIRLRIHGEMHWLRYIIQPLEFAPEKGRIIVAGLVLNIDKQKRHEAALAEAIAKVSESDRMKNAFIANMTSEIRPSLQELITYSTEMAQTQDKVRKLELLEYIEKSNGVLLKYIQNIIQLSQTVDGSPENS